MANTTSGNTILTCRDIIANCFLNNYLPKPEGLVHKLIARIFATLI